MAVIAILIQPNGRTRVLFDCRNAEPRRDDEQDIERAIARSLAAADTEEPRLAA